MEKYSCMTANSVESCREAWSCRSARRIYRNAVVNGGLLVAIVAVQQRTCSTECKVMAIANAYHAASGDDLSKLQFVEANSIN